MSTSFDVIIIGSGPGGYVTAIRAAQLGMKVAIVERDRLGGICLNWGCIPTKALLRSAEVYRNFKQANEYGLSAENVKFDPEAVVKRSRGVAGRMEKGVQFLMKKNKITVVEGEARLEKGSASPKVIVKGKDGKDAAYEAKHVILATGARAREIPAAGLKGDGKRIWTYRDAMTPPEWPESLLVFGSGAIGIEFASFYAAFGVKVTVVELLDRVLPVEDEEISAFAKKRFEKEGLKLLTSTEAKSLKATAKGVEAVVASKGKEETLTASHAIVAVGITGNIENLGLEALGVKTDRGHIVTDGYGKTNVAGLYAIGDVTGGPWLAHKASHEGVICIEAIAGQKAHPMLKERIPGCTYSHPQVASVGLTEAKAKAAGREVKVGRFPFVGNGKAIALGEDQGMVKVVFDAKTGELLGAHMIGAEVTELIQGYVVAMNAEVTEHELMETVFPHPTLSEMMHEAVLDAYGRVLHV
ncbi:MAG TPA: dihydrolipoyl dehydrogenase [Vitreimonas sp.]|uniref:dihydrolipoyl dehydrogenase n=1 Tax=Vitreimonas sp. TaxID=3069702 RepID=UPI002D6FC8F0|nr:dihydrolipoyl dehydrogenase [Vitreimonas sp.]HYD87471.1 dihydrolipoyl dehydrogenase [Vitreimonas sp.]